MDRVQRAVWATATLAVVAAGCASEFDPHGYGCTVGVPGECLDGWVCLAGTCVQDGGAADSTGDGDDADAVGDAGLGSTDGGDTAGPSTAEGGDTAASTGDATGEEVVDDTVTVADALGDAAVKDAAVPVDAIDAPDDGPPADTIVVSDTGPVDATAGIDSDIASDIESDIDSPKLDGGLDGAVAAPDVEVAVDGVDPPVDVEQPGPDVVEPEPDVVEPPGCPDPEGVGTCEIDETCYLAGAGHPVAACLVCDPASPGVWSPQPTGTVCGGTVCAPHRCDGITCEEGGPPLFGVHQHHQEGLTITDVYEPCSSRPSSA